jgi:uncharacterized membrane protein
MDIHRTSNWSLVLLFLISFGLSILAAYIDTDTKSWNDLLTSEMLLTCMLISFISFFIIGVVRMLKKGEGYKYLTIIGIVFTLSLILIFLSGEQMELNKVATLDMFYSGFLCMTYFISRCVDMLLFGRKPKEKTEAIKQP